MKPIPVNLAVEDDLSEAVLRRVLSHVGRGYAIGTAYGRSGFGGGAGIPEPFRDNSKAENVRAGVANSIDAQENGVMAKKETKASKTVETIKHTGWHLPQLDLFADLSGTPKDADKTDFYDDKMIEGAAGS